VSCSGIIFLWEDRSNHVFTHPFGIFFSLSPYFGVHIESRMTPVKNLLDKVFIDQLFSRRREKTSAQVLVYHFLNNWTYVTKVSFKPVLIFKKEWLKIMEEHTVKYGAFRMTWAIDPAHGRDSDSRNVPGRRID